MNDSYEAIGDISNRDTNGYEILKVGLLALLVLMLVGLQASGAATLSNERIDDNQISAETASV